MKYKSVFQSELDKALKDGHTLYVAPIRSNKGVWRVIIKKTLKKRVIELITKTPKKIKQIIKDKMGINYGK